MRSLTSALLAVAPVAFASQSTFSVHDDILAYPQYEVIFSESPISDTAAKLIVEQASSHVRETAPSSSTGIESRNHATKEPDKADEDRPFDPAKETFEIMKLDGEQYLCTIPIVDTPPRNETAEAEAKAAQQKELARASDRGWELLQDLEGNCLYFVDGWWSYAFCYNSQLTQFHQLPPQPGKPALPPVRDTNTKEFVLGRAKKPKAKSDEWSNAVSPQKSSRHDAPKTELQVKGDTRYLVQRMEEGTICDLTGKPRQVEIQFHCSPQITDRIGYIKEVQTCSYLLVVYTPRLCNDVAFMPPKSDVAHPINCRTIIPSSEIETETALKAALASVEAEIKAATPTKSSTPRVNVGGLILGGGRWATKDGSKLAIPSNFGVENFGKQVEIIAKAKSKSEGGQVEMASPEELKKMDLDPEMVMELRTEVEKMAKEKGWQIRVVDQAGEERAIFGILDSDDDDKDSSDGGDGEGKKGSAGAGSGAGEKRKEKEKENEKEEESEVGSEEVFKDEL
ncbi:hypothetical protein HYALB_00001824 [Hymenoscyphus albidus]|uniref:Endoplasmic reticulum lectin n=1 Tax=Hymenoscyphus albidus TaxID=595503 RepID=A0A9N9LML7_9HELO|nr:hypothetical protein HYALB_00001824 [Hymenoscyphus albidus]